MKKTILFINSGSRLKEFILQKAKEMGLNLVLVNNSLTWQKPYVDYFIQADTYSHQEVLRKAEEFAKDHSVDGVVTFWERDVVLAVKVAQILGLPGMSVEAAQRGRNKLLMAETLLKANVPCPRFCPVDSFKDLFEGLRYVRLPAILKPLSGAASKNVVKITTNNKQELQKLFSSLFTLTQPEHDPIFYYDPGKFLLEEYLDGPEVSVEGIVEGKNIHLVAITDKLPMNGPYFIERGDNLPSRHSKELQKKIYEITKKAIKALGFENCGIHAEIRIVKNEPKIIEIAARLGGDYLCNWVETVYGVDLVKNVIKIALREPVDIKRKFNGIYLSGRYFIPQKSGRIKTFIGLEDLRKLAGIHEVKILFDVGDDFSLPPQKFDYLGWVVAKGDSPQEADRIVEEALKKFQVEIVEDSIKPGLVLFRESSTIKSNYGSTLSKIS